MRWIVGCIVLALVGIGGYTIMKIYGTDAGVAVNVSQDSNSMYASSQFGIAFAYPSAYSITEYDTGNGERVQHQITLIHSDNLPLPEAGEGPLSITIAIYQNNLDNQTTEGWIHNTSFSNFKLSPDGVLSASSVAGENALSYTWDGLYRGETTVIARPAYVYAFSVTYHSPTDPIRADFKTMMDTVVFE